MLSPATLLLLPLVTATTISSSSEPLPLLIWHGLGDEYSSDGMTSVAELAKQTNPGTFVYNIRLDEDPGNDRSATWFGNLTEQIQHVCEDLASHPELSKYAERGVNALGFSQGGNFLRGFVERCNVPPVRNLVTFGSQHNGIHKYQNCGATDWVCKTAMALLRSNTWSDFVQSRLVPAQYYRETDFDTGEPTSDYLDHSNFLADINNERPLKNTTYAKNLASLDRFVMYVFRDDVTVIPKESGWFAQTNISSGEVTKLRDREIYKRDWVGLKALDEKGGLEFKTCEGGHMQLSEELLVDVFETYYAPKTLWDHLVEDAVVQEVLEL